mmetsp:Transcript_37835/g.78561  ORF Transcript_37835/g.78561 Transcript_37835/m.78561 type:complete len:148 (-) Transcript_37835:640-1083(-)
MSFQTATQQHTAFHRSLGDEIGDGDGGTSPMATPPANEFPTDLGNLSPVASPVAAPIASPTIVQTTSSPAPTKAPTTSSGGDDGDVNKMVAIVPFLGILVCFLGFRCYRNLRRKREQHLLNLRSAQADSVLGDMQMIPSEDPDQDLL